MPWASQTLSAPTSKLVNARDVRELLGIADRTLFNMVARGDFPQPLKNFKMRKWYRSDVENWLERQRPQAG